MTAATSTQVLATPAPPALIVPSSSRAAHRPAVCNPVFDLESGTLLIRSWTDDVHDTAGHDPRSDYVERFWLSILGPSTTWLLRSLAWGLESHPDGFDLDLLESARALGLGDRLGRQSPFVRALTRMCQFDMAAVDEHDISLRVRRRVPWLSRRMVMALAPGLRAEHTQWEIVAAASRHPARGSASFSAPGA